MRNSHSEVLQIKDKSSLHYFIYVIASNGILGGSNHENYIQIGLMENPWTFAMHQYRVELHYLLSLSVSFYNIAHDVDQGKKEL